MRIRVCSILLWLVWVSSCEQQPKAAPPSGRQLDMVELTLPGDGLRPEIRPLASYFTRSSARSRQDPRKAGPCGGCDKKTKHAEPTAPADDGAAPIAQVTGRSEGYRTPTEAKMAERRVTVRKLGAGGFFIYRSCPPLLRRVGAWDVFARALRLSSSSAKDASVGSLTDAAVLAWPGDLHEGIGALLESVPGERMSGESIGRSWKCIAASSRRVVVVPVSSRHHAARIDEVVISLDDDGDIIQLERVVAVDYEGWVEAHRLVLLVDHPQE